MIGFRSFESTALGGVLARTLIDGISKPIKCPHFIENLRKKRTIPIDKSFCGRGSPKRVCELWGFARSFSRKATLIKQSNSSLNQNLKFGATNASPYGFEDIDDCLYRLRSPHPPSKMVPLPLRGRLGWHCIGNNPSVKIEDFATSLYTREAKVTLLLNWTVGDAGTYSK